MPDQNWTPMAIATLAVAIATMLLAFATAFSPALRLIQSRSSQPKLKHKTKIPTRYKFLLLPAAGFALNVFLLIRELRASSPLTKGTVVSIAVSVCALNIVVVYTVFVFVIDRVLSIMRDIINQQRDFRSALIAVLDKLLDVPASS